MPNLNETTQAELLELAQKHAALPRISAILTSIAEAKMLAKSGLQQVQAYARLFTCAIDGEGRVCLDNSDLVRASAQATAAMARLNLTYTLLALALVELGEPVVY